jgi:hypothetical protein
LIDTYGAETICNLLIAFGYARDPKEPTAPTTPDTTDGQPNEEA